jgi:hypothetical protein
MQRCRRSPRHTSFWVFIINYNPSNASERYNVLKIQYNPNMEMLWELAANTHTIYTMRCATSWWSNRFEICSRWKDIFVIDTGISN